MAGERRKENASRPLTLPQAIPVLALTQPPTREEPERGLEKEKER